MVFTSKLYDVLKAVAMIYLPAATTLYFAVASIWGIPDTANVIGTMTAVDTFLGGILGLSAKNYVPPTDGAIVMNNGQATKIQMPLTAEEIAAKGTVTLQIQHDISPTI